MDTLKFPEKFLFGTSVSAYQVEGNSGSRKGDWDEYLENRKFEIIRPGERGPEWWKEGFAEKDLETIAGIGMQMQRFSIEWSRVEPEEGVINHNALKRYKEIFEKLKLLKLTPMVTINHYVLPVWVAKQGGWTNQKTVTAFLKFVKLILTEFTDIPYWCIINEPAVVLTFGYIIGYFPPREQNLFQFMAARKHLIQAHNRAYELIKEYDPYSQAGSAYSLFWLRPQTRKYFIEHNLTRIMNYLLNTNYIDATVNHMDYLGINYYTGYYIQFSPFNLDIEMRTDTSLVPRYFPFTATRRPHSFRNDYGWPIAPDFFVNMLHTMRDKYHKPIIITENGIADADDVYRPFYILTHLVGLWKALQLGVDIRGYLYWATVDNIEWNEGYQKRFGLIDVNHFTGKRMLRTSSGIYKEIAESGEINVDKLIKKYVPLEQQDIAREVIIKLLTDPHKHTVRVEYAMEAGRQ